MKKFLVSISLVISCFFFFNYSVEAKVADFTINYDIHEHFNFFYEQKNNTGFYQMLISDKYDAYFGSPSRLWIYYTDDLRNAYSADSSSVFADVPYPENSKYTVIYTSSSFQESFHYELDNLYFNFSCNYGNPASLYYVFFDEEGKLILNSNYIVSQCRESFMKGSFNVNDTSYFMSMFYDASVSYLNSSYPNLRLNNVILNDTSYYLKDLKTRSGWSNFWSNLFNNKEIMNLDDYGLGYFIRNYYNTTQNDGSKYIKGLKTLLFSSSNSYTASVPSGFSSSTFSYDDRKFLIPNSKSCSFSDSLLYFQASNVNSLNLINYSLLKDDIDYTNLNGFSFSLKKANNIEVLSLSSYLDSDSLISDYFYLLYSSDNFTANTFYYNPNCYSVYSAVDSSDLSFININSGNTITLTPGEKNLIIGKSNDFSSSLIESNSNSSSDIDISSIIGGAWTGAKTFISSSYYIMSMTSNLFSLLPPSVSSLILCVFSLGMVIILWKVFRS